jgi:hypothetical protein
MHFDVVFPCAGMCEQYFGFQTAKVLSCVNISPSSEHDLVTSRRQGNTTTLQGYIFALRATENTEPVYVQTSDGVDLGFCPAGAKTRKFRPSQKLLHLIACGTW